MLPKFLESLVQAAAAQGGAQTRKEDQGGHPMFTKWANCAQQKVVYGVASQEKNSLDLVDLQMAKSKLNFKHKSVWFSVVFAA